jgi:hypothetical protein
MKQGDCLFGRLWQSNRGTVCSEGYGSPTRVRLFGRLWQSNKGTVCSESYDSPTRGLFIRKVMAVQNYGLGSPFDTVMAILGQTAVRKIVSLGTLRTSSTQVLIKKSGFLYSWVT